MKELKGLKKKLHELHVLVSHTDVSKVNDIEFQTITKIPEGLSHNLGDNKAAGFLFRRIGQSLIPCQVSGRVVLPESIGQKDGMRSRLHLFCIDMIQGIHIFEYGAELSDKGVRGFFIQFQPGQVSHMQDLFFCNLHHCSMVFENE